MSLFDFFKKINEDIEANKKQVIKNIENLNRYSDNEEINNIIINVMEKLKYCVSQGELGFSATLDRKYYDDTKKTLEKYGFYVSKIIKGTPETVAFNIVLTAETVEKNNKHREVQKIINMAHEWNDNYIHTQVTNVVEYLKSVSKLGDYSQTILVKTRLYNSIERVLESKGFEVISLGGDKDGMKPMYILAHVHSKNPNNVDDPDLQIIMKNFKEYNDNN